MLKKKQGIKSLIFFLLQILFLILSDALPVITNNSFASEQLPLTSGISLSSESLSGRKQFSSNIEQPILSTSYKKYSLCRYDDYYILCEPYKVQPGDWIYKIFRAKGELSKEDFGLFIRIFKVINPDIKNINTIQKNQIITIPLKKSKQNDFKESEPGMVELPIITLSNTHNSNIINLNKQENIQENLDSAQQQNSLAESNHLPESNEAVKDSLDKEDYYNSANLNSTTLFDTSTSDHESIPKKKSSSKIPFKKLKNFAMINNGELMIKGKYYFPRDNGGDLVIDAAINPIVKLKNGSKILFVPERNGFQNIVETIRKFWKDFAIMEFKDADTSINNQYIANQSKKPSRYKAGSQQIEDQSSNNISTAENKKYDKLSPSVSGWSENNPKSYVPINSAVSKDHKHAVSQLLQIVNIKYVPEQEISLSVGNIKINVSPGVIIREGRRDIIVVFGDIYGTAFEALKDIKQSDILSISPLLTTMDTIKKLFAKLGASLTENPSFINPVNDTPVLLNGIYIKNNNKELFITEKPSLLSDAFNYLTQKGIIIIKITN